ncbi:hypothetical protein KAH55_07905 [bacterium]|nr:hypothetical protein [bacterium]
MRSFFSTIKVLLLFLILIVVGSSCDDPMSSKDKLLPIDFLPQSGDIPGWNRSLDTGSRIEAESAQTLNALVDGDKKIGNAAYAHSFVRALKQVFDGRISTADEKLEVRIYDFETRDNAAGYYTDEDVVPSGHDVLRPILGDDSRINITTSQYLTVVELYYEKWYVYIYIKGTWGPGAARTTAINFAAEIAANLERHYPRD